MIANQRVLCLSAGMLAPKKTGLPYGREHLYLNYGLLGLASVLRRAGYDPIVMHGRFTAPTAFVEALERGGELETPLPILLSIPSSFALPWAREATREIKRLRPNVEIVVGGRWVTADDGDWIRRQIPDADLVVLGTAESRIERILRPEGWRSLPGTDRALSIGAPAAADEMPELDYRLLDRFADFHPSLEVARGCGMGCSFCAEANVPLGVMKPAAVVVRELAALALLYDDGRTWNAYLEASLFRPSRTWIDDLERELDARRLRVSWRTETRVDALNPEKIARLARLGLRVIDLGLESASARQLAAMRKAEQPEVYLRKASTILEACRDAGIWPKVNLLLHPGETPDTVGETQRWLDAHRSCVKGVSIGPTIIYRYGRATAKTVHEFEGLGARLVDPVALERDGFAHLHLSESLPHDAAVAVSRSLSREFMTERDYFDLKAFSYLPRGTKWDTFRDGSVAGPGVVGQQPV